MGHISRHVRPGSTAVKGLVDSGAGRTFRPPGQAFAGGGINDLARNGIELTVWPCEGSTRQVFKLNKHEQLEVSGHDWLGKPTKSCIGKSMDPSFKGLLLGICNRTMDKAGEYEVVPVANDTVDYVNIRIKNGPKRHKCLAIQELKNGGGAYGLRGGSQVVLGNCSDFSAQWTISHETGEISSVYFEEGEVCMTTGWPFLQMGAFLTPNGDTDRTMVILNEAAEGANYIIRNKQDIILTGVIPAHSIQTVILDN
jgi:glucosylceramidase